MTVQKPVPRIVGDELNYNIASSRNPNTVFVNCVWINFRGRILWSVFKKIVKLWLLSIESYGEWQKVVELRFLLHPKMQLKGPA